MYKTGLKNHITLKINLLPTADVKENSQEKGRKT
jgi:hypothetical protein